VFEYPAQRRFVNFGLAILHGAYWGLRPGPDVATSGPASGVWRGQAQKLSGLCGGGSENSWPARGTANRQILRKLASSIRQKILWRLLFLDSSSSGGRAFGGGMDLTEIHGGGAGVHRAVPVVPRGAWSGGSSSKRRIVVRDHPHPSSSGLVLVDGPH